MKLTKQIHSLRKASQWKRVDQVLMAEVWPLPKTELDRPFDDRIDDELDYLSLLDGLLKMEAEAEGGNLVGWIPIEVLGRLLVSSESGQCLG